VTKTLIEITPEVSWFQTNGYELETKDKNGTGEVWKNTKTGEWVIVSRTSAWTTVFFPTTGEFRQFPATNFGPWTFAWTKEGVDKAIRAAFTQFPQWGTTFQVAETFNTENDTWGVSWQKAGETFTAWITKTAVTGGNLAWIADQFAKSPIFA
jgi:hypothetical protein